MEQESGKETAGSGREPVRYQYGPEWPPSQDEISLFDLWDVLVRRWRWIAGVLLAVVLLGVTHALRQVPVYEYTHAIEIGKQVVGDEQRPIESPSSVAAKLEQNYVPSAIRAWLMAQPDAESQPDVSTSVPSDAEIVVLKGTGPESRQAVYVEILEDAAERLEQDHQRIIETIRQQLMVELTQAKGRIAALRDELTGIRDRYRLDIEKARNQLSDLEDQAQLARQELDRLDRREALLRAEVEELQADLQEAEKNRTEATRNLGSPAEAMTLVMLSNEIRETRRRLSNLRTQLEVELANQRDRMRSKIADLERRIETQGGEVEVLQGERDAKLAAKANEIEVQQGRVETHEVRLENLSRTQPLSEPQRSLRPVGTGKRVIVVLSVVLGGMLGVFAAFFAEFVHAANRRRRGGGAAEAEAGS